MRCFSEKTYLRLEEVFKKLVVKEKEKEGKDLKESENEAFYEAPQAANESENGWKYEPTNSVYLAGLRLGIESGWEGWYRVWRQWKQGQEINDASFRKFCEVSG